VEPGMSYDITLTTKATFVSTSVFILSFKVEEKAKNSERLVLAIWWQPRINKQAAKFGW
jgi:hypothetical protein